MTPPRPFQRVRPRPLPILLAAAWLAGCAGSGPEPRSNEPAFRGIEAAEEAVGASESPLDRSPNPIVAVADDLSIPREEVWTHLGEAAGGQVLEEVILEKLLEQELARRGLSVSAADIDQERELVLSSLAEQPGSGRNEAVRLLSALRARRGLGEARFESLLRRNAMLRRLVEDEVTVTAEDIERLYRVRHGEKYRIRLLLAPTERRAAEIRRDIMADPAALRTEFARQAMEHSVDESAFRGGLIEPFSPEDPAYPDAVRSMVTEMAPGSVSPVVALDTGFALVLLEERLPATGISLARVEENLANELRIRNERIRMDTLAQQLVNRASITVRDPTLARAWNQRRRAESR